MLTTMFLMTTKSRIFWEFTDFLAGTLALGGRGSGASLSPELLLGVLKPTDEPEVSAHVYCPPELE